MFIVMLVFASAIQLFAQKTAAFSDLQRHINKEVTVHTVNASVTGQLLRVEESRLVINDAGTPRPIARDTVKKVTKHKSRHTAAWIAGMSAAGVGAGLLIGLRAFDDATNANRKVGAAAGIGAGAGAAAGYGLSRIGKSDEVIYRSE
jgi:hypothetical protein